VGSERALSPEGQKPEPPADEMTLRSLLWAGHAGENDGHYRYGDDGELQCSGIDGACDFRREPVAKIREHIEKRGWRLMSGGQKPEAPEPPEPPVTLGWFHPGAPGAPVSEPVA
jgi:hypothetical protein